MDDRLSITEPNLLLVEGKDDELLLRALLRNVGIGNIQVLSTEGKEKLAAKLQAVNTTTLKRTPVFWFSAD